MSGRLAKLARRFSVAAGYELVPLRPESLSDLDDSAAETYERVAEYTMTTPERVAALCAAVEHVEQHDVPGAIVECGVWRGGSMMAVAETLGRLGVTGRELYLFDTFAGMPPPGEWDVRYGGESARELLEDRREGERVQASASLDDVRRNVLGTGYPSDRVRFVEGMVEDTIPEQAPEAIAVLRLDTDWYESTRHELVHLYPRLTSGGVLILDDYGCWLGARRAVDEYLEETDAQLFLTRIDSSGRLAVKP